jgi:hypothetical protein
MTLQKLILKPGVNKENTRYTNEGGWYDCDKIRFRQGTPEKIGGWSQISSYTYLGTCRSLWSWASLSRNVFIGVGTYLKFYIAQSGYYNDVTPMREYAPGLSGPFTVYKPQNFTVTVANPAVVTLATATIVNGATVTLATTGALPTGLVAGQTYYVVNASGLTCNLSLTYGGPAIQTFGTQNGTHSLTCNTVLVTDAGHGATDGDFVNFLGASALSTQTFTRSTATNFVLTSALVANTPVILSVSSGGSLPTGLVAGVQYYINIVSGTTVTFALSAGGAPVTTSTAGSGTFSLYVNSGMTGSVLNSDFQVSVINSSTYLIYPSVSAGAYDTGTGGTVNAAYQIHVGQDSAQPLAGWGAGSWGSSYWGTGQSGTSAARLWYQNNFGQDLVYGYRGGPMYYWDANIGSSKKTFTVTIAAPGVFTLTSGAAILGEAIVLNSTGSLPTGLTIGTVYYAGGISGATFKLATTYANAIAGTFITTTGTQSGTHYVMPNGLPITSQGGASDVPAYVNFVLISDASRFTIAFGCTPYGGGDLDPMLIRWSDQESVVNWTPAVTNQSGYVRLSHGSEILTAVQTRQEIVVFTDTSIYSLQYLGPPYIWGTQLLGDNVSIAGYNTAIVASGVVYWMGVDKFYKYDGRVQTLRCDLRQFIYNDINLAQQIQFFAGTNEGFNEVWWFYCTSESTVIDRYVVYNYAEDVWYYGELGRTAWLDSGLTNYPLAATYVNNLVYHENGVDDNTTNETLPIEAYITSSQYDIGDGHNFGFVWRIVPDLTFRGSSTTGETPQVTMYLLPLQNSGSGYNDPVESGNQSVGGISYANVSRVGTYTVDQFTGQIYTRVRGRQMAIKISSNRVGTTWQLGSPRIDIRPDGRR